MSFVNPFLLAKVIKDPIPHHSIQPVSLDELQYKKVCYFTNWSQYRSGPARFEPEHIDPFLCTHIVYAFAYINNQTLSLTEIEPNDEGLYERMILSK